MSRASLQRASVKDFSRSGWILGVLQPALAVLLGLFAGVAVSAAVGENPWHVLQVLWNGAFGSRYDFAMTVFYSTPLIFTGLSVAVAFRAGLFNIGGEGQLALGSFAAAAVGALASGTPAWCAPLLAMLAAAVVGGFWGWIPGWLRARRGSHEVINTIMLNFIAAGICSYLTLYWIKNPDTQNPETLAVGAGFMLERWQWAGDAPLGTSVWIALAAVAAVWFLFEKTVLGFELQAVGESESAARAAGLPVARLRMIAMTLAGALAGGVAVVEVLQASGRFRLGFSPDYGFIGIAVALLARNRPVGIVFSALLFGALHKGASSLDFETEKVTRDLSLILEAFVILSVSATSLWSMGWLKRRLNRGGAQ
jgi:ABC-type uncharacterized transport system permease subunit